MQQNKKSAVKYKTGTSLGITKKNFQDEELSHELFLSTRQTTKINALTNNMPIDIKLSKSQLSKIIQVGEFLSKTLGNLDKKALLQLLFLWLKIGNQEKDFFLFISNEDMDDNIKIVELLEKLGLFIDGVTETVKHKIKKQEGGFLWAIAASLIAPVATSFI